MADHVFVAKLPICDIHAYRMNDETVEAHYDGATVFGHWANMCDDCFGKYGHGVGTGVGQRLVLIDH